MYKFEISTLQWEIMGIFSRLFLQNFREINTFQHALQKHTGKRISEKIFREINSLVISLVN